MNEQQIRNIIKQEIANSQKDALYSIKNVAGHIHNGIDAPRISYPNISDTIPYYSIGISSNGTNVVNVFGSTGFAYSFTITSVLTVSEDTTAANITLSNNGNTVVVIAKGTTAGGVVGGYSLANTSYNANNPITIVSSSAGNAIVIITFTI